MNDITKKINFNDLIKKLFHDKKWENRAEAARKLGYLKDGKAVNLMCRALNKEKDYVVINHIIEALGKIKNPKAVKDILNIFEEELKKPLDKFRIKIIIESLTKIKDKRCLSYIGILLNSEDPELKKLTKKAFNAILPNWFEIIKEKKENLSFSKIFDFKL
ncbi:MAG: HEAT repeat domain-containing protein [Candidatus Lokiarchaeota archaeon]|nr:HEAT repeat domain-containing protein [Candidatus Lokiarchaeota archaeon]